MLTAELFPEMVNFLTKNPSFPNRFDEVKTRAIRARRLGTCSKFNVDYDARIYFGFWARQNGSFLQFWQVRKFHVSKRVNTSLALNVLIWEL